MRESKTAIWNDGIATTTEGGGKGTTQAVHADTVATCTANSAGGTATGPGNSVGKVIKVLVIE